MQGSRLFPSFELNFLRPLLAREISHTGDREVKARMTKRKKGDKQQKDV